MFCETCKPRVKHCGPICEMAKAFITKGNCIPGHQRPFASDFRLRRSPHGRGTITRASPTEVRIIVIETTLNEMKRDVSDVKEIQRTLVQVVEGAKYVDKFRQQLQDFSEKLQPIQQSITELQESQKDLQKDMQDSQQDLRKDMQDSQRNLQNELQQIKWGGTFVVAVLSLFCTLFGNVSDKLPQVGVALIVAVLVPVLLATAIAALTLLWRKSFSSSEKTTAQESMSASTS